MSTLLERVEAAAKARYGDGVGVKYEPERGAWLTGLVDRAVAGKDLLHLATLLGVSRRPLSHKLVASMLGLRSAANLSRFAKKHSLPHERGRAGRLVFYADELRRWMESVKFDRARTAAKAAAGTKAAATLGHNGHRPDPGQARRFMSKPVPELATVRQLIEALESRGRACLDVARALRAAIGRLA